MNQTKKGAKTKQEIRSGEVQEILGTPPRWIVRWGISMIFAIIIIFLTGSYVFKYPDIISAPVVITTENPPATIIAKATGNIQNLYVKDQDPVQSEQILAVIENPAKVENVYNLVFSLTDFRHFLRDFDTGHIPELEDVQDLGIIQPAYSKFQKAFMEYASFLEIGYHTKKIQSLREEIEKYRVFHQRLIRQKNLLASELELDRIRLERDSLLFIQTVLSPADYDASKSSFYEKQRDYEQALANISSVDIEISVKEQAILDLELEYQNQRDNFRIGLTEAYDNLKSEIARWEQAYVLKAPKHGVVSFSRFWTEEQNVTEGDAVLSVVPENPGAIIGKMNLSIRRSGKVSVGQDVLIKVDNYPYMEYGLVEGIIHNISLVPTDQYYTVEISLPEQLLTNYGKSLDFNQEMSGMAEIITEKRRLIARIVDPFKYIFEKNL